MMSTQRKWLLALLSAMLTVPLTGTATALAETPQSSAITQSEESIQASLSDMPASLRPSIEWVYKNRMLKENSVGRKNLIFDQIFAGKGTINYVVRWQSAKNLALQQRQDIERMLGRQLNNWTKHLKGYDGWPYGDIPVKVVGWAVANPAQILNKQPNEIVYTQTIVDELSKTDPRIPAALPVAPSALSRFDHFTDPNYAYPGGLDKRFDMYLWGTTNFGGGAGGDWGQRMSDDYILSTVNNNEIQITEHEIGHGFGMPDFYGENDRPQGGFPVPTIMWAGNSAKITDWDIWLLRYTWSQLKQDSQRFRL
ncbi:dockerin [Paenibacillus macerans]|uniref:dockerin n=3 Tax=Paenibacillus macerans TaxID=44252 RepID=UPI0026AD6402